MSHSRTWLAVSALAIPLLAGRGHAADTTVVDDASNVIAVQSVAANDTGISGLLVNRTGSQLENVELLVVDSFVWRNERSPGADDPGNAFKTVIRGPIPPRASVPFQVERSLPVRRDGTFATSVDVLRLTLRDEAPLRTGDAR